MTFLETFDTLKSSTKTSEPVLFAVEQNDSWDHKKRVFINV